MHDHVYEYENIVIGGTLPAVLYSFINNIPIIFYKPSPPSITERIEHLASVSFLKLADDTKELKTNVSTEIVGMTKLELWNKINFILCMSGRNLLSDKADTIRIHENTIKVATTGHRSIKMHFDKLYLFDKSVELLPGTRDKGKSCKVYDWFHVKSSSEHDFDIIKTGDKFVNNIQFYSLPRKEGGKTYKDLVVESIIAQEKLNNFEYSDLYVKFKTIDDMERVGIVGSKNGSGTRIPIGLEHVKREVKKINDWVYNDTEKVEFVDLDMKGVLDTTEDIHKELWKLSQTIWPA